MSRRIVVATLGALALGVSRSDAQDPPPLEAPLASPADSPPTPPPAERKPAERPSRPLLVIPGVTAPMAGRSAYKPVAEAEAESPAPPVLDGPVADAKPAASIPLRFEPVPEPASTSDAARRPRVVTSRPAPARDPAAPKSAFGHDDPPPPEDDLEASAPAPSRRPGPVFGRFLPSGGAASSARDGLKVESHGDPAAEAAVKRRVEKQVRDTLGDRVKDVEVRVSGRSVVVRARPSRFWYRWSARRTLDALPMPSGYRGRVELLD